MNINPDSLGVDSDSLTQARRSGEAKCSDADMMDPIKIGGFGRGNIIVGI